MTPRSRAALAAAALAGLTSIAPLAVAACSLIDPFPDYGDSSVQVSDTGSAESGVNVSLDWDALVPCTRPENPPNGYCTPAIPNSGWQGPVVLYPVKSVCSGNYSTIAFEGITNPSTAAATCGCSCAGGCTATLTNYANSNCGFACSGQPIDMTVGLNDGGEILECLDASSGCGAYTTESLDFSASPAPCSPVPSTSVPASGGFVTACSPSALDQGSCSAGETCMPKPSFSPPIFCIYAPGPAACPDAGYQVTRDAYEDASDTRGCSACECSSPSSCSGSATLFSGPSCSGSKNYAVSGCLSEETPFESVLVEVHAVCKPTVPVPEGTVITSGEETFCCTQ